MDYLNERSSVYVQHKREFADFLETESQKQKLRETLITQSINQSNIPPRYLLDLSDLRLFDRAIAERFLLYPMQYWAPWLAALREAARLIHTPINPAVKQSTNQSILLGVTGDFGSRRLSPRQLQAHHLGQLLCVEGIVTKLSVCRPKVEKTVHFNQLIDQYIERDFHDNTSLTGATATPMSNPYPTKDDQGMPLQTEFGLSVYGDSQSISLQEMPERAPAGLLPSSIDVTLDHDLIDRCKPGDRVRFVGVYRAMSTKMGIESSGVCRSMFLACSVQPLARGEASGDSILTDRQISRIRAQARSEDIFHRISRSMAPSIYGHHGIKQALALLMLGGVEKNLANGTHLRGDVNLLMVGDPSTAKSQLLRFVLSIAPLGVNTTGRGSSGVGLTAAVVVDRESGERRLEAGAMVLADRGIVCIDEFDKMSDVDRVAIHEVMEQQTVTISKAGVHMSLNARCSVLAAANPRYSHYQSNKSPAYNVNLPDSLLSRFDLLFIVLDEPNPETDRGIAERVLQNHRFGLNQSTNHQSVNQSNAEEEQSSDQQEDDDQSIYQTIKQSNGDMEKIYTMSFLRQYFAFAKSMVSPVLSSEAAELITASYTQLRTDQSNKQTNGYPITARCLETLIRLSTAHAKCRLDEVVTVDDVNVALGVLKAAMSGSTQEKSAPHVDDEDEYIPDVADSVMEEEKMNDEEEEKEDVEPTRPVRSVRQSNKRSQSSASKPSKRAKQANDMDVDDDEPVDQPITQSSLAQSASTSQSVSQPGAVSQSSKSSRQSFDLSSPRGQTFKRLIFDCLRYEPNQSIAQVLSFINQADRLKSEAAFDRDELLRWVEQLEEGQIMYEDSTDSLLSTL